MRFQQNSQLALQTNNEQVEIVEKKKKELDNCKHEYRNKILKLTWIIIKISNNIINRAAKDDCKVEYSSSSIPYIYDVNIAYDITIDSNIINTGNKSPVEAVIVDLTISNLLLNDK